MIDNISTALDMADVGLSIVIPSARPNWLLRSILSSVEQSSRVATIPVQVIVVLDGHHPENDWSQRTSLGESRLAEFNLVRTRGAEGPARARNVGILRTRYDHILLLDDDVLPWPNFLDAVETCLPLGTGEAAMCLVSHYHRQWREPMAMRYRTTWLGLPDRLLGICEGGRLPWKLMQSCALLMKREDMLRLGGFDEEFRDAHYEDMDLSARFHDAGGSIRIAKRIRVEHVGYRTSDEQLVWCLRNGYWKARFCMLHPRRANEVLAVIRGPVGPLKLEEIDGEVQALPKLVASLGVLENRGEWSNSLQTAFDRTLGLAGILCERQGMLAAQIGSEGFREALIRLQRLLAVKGLQPRAAEENRADLVRERPSGEESTREILGYTRNESLLKKQGRRPCII